MSESGGDDASTRRAEVDSIYRAESRRVFASLVRLLRDFDLAEEALQEAFTAALEQWPRDGLPRNPRGWLTSVGRFRGIDARRRRRRLESALAGDVEERRAFWPPEAGPELDEVDDDRLRLLFACCRPELSREAQVALTLREVCGLTTEEIARAYLTRPSTVAQRIVRGKQRIRDLGLTFEVPPLNELPERRNLVLEVLYLVFNEGYAASKGPYRVRADLCEEAIRLGRLVAELVPHPECDAFLSLLLLQDARRSSRSSETGAVVLFAEQDRSLWDRERLREGTRLLEEALAAGACGLYATRAAIAAVYAASVDSGVVDWAEVVALHDFHLTLDPSPVARLARAIALAERDGPEVALPLVDELGREGRLDEFLPLYAARADLHRRLGHSAEAAEAYGRALVLANAEPERRFLRERLAEMEGKLAP